MPNMTEHYVLMGDIIKSRVYDAEPLIRDFVKLISDCNEKLKYHILSPYTSTLGDEFQGIARSLRSAIETIFYFEEEIIKRSLYFKLRYVVHLGPIETPINSETAYGMLGEGLTRARELLADKRKNRPKLLFDLPNNPDADQLNRLFSVIGSLMADWRNRDYPLIYDMIVFDNDNDVAKRNGKNRSQIWKRRKQLHVTDYKNLKKVIFDIAQG